MRWNSIIEAIKKAGYKPGEEVMIGLWTVLLRSSIKTTFTIIPFLKEPNGAKRTSTEQVLYLEELIDKYPIDSIEDGMD